ncbi:unnamed protein product, partial [Prorocentrum cordatum]
RHATPRPKLKQPAARGRRTRAACTAPPSAPGMGNPRPRSQAPAVGGPARGPPRGQRRARARAAAAAACRGAVPLQLRGRGRGRAAEHRGGAGGVVGLGGRRGAGLGRRGRRGGPRARWRGEADARLHELTLPSDGGARCYAAPPPQEGARGGIGVLF